MYKVGIIGPESTGKSTLAQYLAQRYDGVLIPEYAREYMCNLAPTYDYTYQDVENIAQHQVAQLQEMHRAARQDSILFFDTELIITKVWFLHKYHACPVFVENALREYPMDVYLLCYPDIPWEPDPIRENPHLRQYLYDWYEREIQNLDIPYYVIRHDL